MASRSVNPVRRPPLEATVYRTQKLRCHLCGKLFTADLPEEAGTQKYDPTVGSMIGLLKYGSGLPFNRLEGLQGNLGMPLPASTQWFIVRDTAHTSFLREVDVVDRPIHLSLNSRRGFKPDDNFFPGTPAKPLHLLPQNGVSSLVAELAKFFQHPRAAEQVAGALGD